jgi:hypothetical protein
MPEQTPGFGAEPVALAFQALLYASGEMDGTEARAFEARLGEDQAARDALCHAVHLSHPEAALGTLRPNPAYRSRIHAQVRNQRGFWHWLAGRRSYRGHPFAWTGLGVAATLLIAFASGQGFGLNSSSRDQAFVDGRGERAAEGTRANQNQNERASASKENKLSAPPRPAEPVTTSAEARVWAELQSSMAWRRRIFATNSMKH